MIECIMIEYTVIFTLLAGNIVVLTWALTLQRKIRQLREELFGRSQWNWRQAKRWRNK